MPQSAITPIAAATPPPAVANANAQVSARTSGETSGDAAPAQPGGFADALKRQLNGSGQAKDKEKETSTQAKAPEDAAPATVPLIPFAPPDLASLLPGLNLKPQTPFLAQGSDGGQTGASAALSASSGILSGGNGILPGAKGKEALASLADLRADAGQPGSLATADFAAAGKVAQDKLAPLTGSPAGNDEKASVGQASSDNFQAALAASSAQQAAEHARVAETVARQQTQAPATTVATPVNAPGWSEDVGNKLVWMAGADQHKAELVLTPPNMGRIEVSITVNNDQATANFVAASSEVRDALEQSLPRLREMFANAGISLGQANVSGESSAGQQSGREERGRRYGGVDALAASAAVAPAPLLRGGNGMVDTFV